MHQILKLRKFESQLNFQATHETKYKGIAIYLYTYVNNKLDKCLLSFNSIVKLSSYLGVARTTIKVYLNTYVPYKNYLFLTTKIKPTDFIETEKLVSDGCIQQ